MTVSFKVNAQAVFLPEASLAMRRFKMTIPDFDFSYNYKNSRLWDSNSDRQNMRQRVDLRTTTSAFLFIQSTTFSY